jgi:hypothetical protein
MKKICLLYLFIVLVSFTSCSQEETNASITKQMDSLGIPTLSDSLSPFKNDSYLRYSDKWVELTKGISYIEKTAPTPSVVNDSKISILKIDPSVAEFEIKSATQNNNEALCVVDYAEKFNYNIVINASMYDLRNQLKSKGLLINDKSYANNPELYPQYNMMICANPTKDGLPNFCVNDLTLKPWNTIRTKYESFAQGLRMIDGNGNPMSWNKRKQSCSQLIVAEDKQGMIYFIFTRSPYSQNYMIEFMVNMGLLNAIYMEGGPQTSLFVHIGDHRIEKLGSYVSNTYPTDANGEFWPLPNVIGVRVKP